MASLNIQFNDITMAKAAEIMSRASTSEDRSYISDIWLENDKDDTDKIYTGIELVDPDA